MKISTIRMGTLMETQDEAMSTRVLSDIVECDGPKLALGMKIPRSTYGSVRYHQRVCDGPFLKSLSWSCVLSLFQSPAVEVVVSLWR